jgi:hypothetical protein
VEGFTHPLWTALMVPANALAAVDLRYRSLLVQLLSLAILIAHVVIVRRLTLRHFTAGQARHWLPAALLTAAYYPLNYWALMGMESGLQALLTTASVLLALDIVCLGRDRHRQLLLLGAAAYLLRMDMLLVVATVQLFVITCGGLRREQRASWLQGAALFAAAAGGYSVFRWLYFGDVLPNTYYLKLYQVPLAVRLMRGTRMLSASLSDHLLLLVVVAVGVLVLLRERPEAPRAAAADALPAGAPATAPGAAAEAASPTSPAPSSWPVSPAPGQDAAAAGCELRRRLLLPSLIFVAACAYSVYVGGDAWEMPLNVRANRFLVFAMPMVFILFNALLNLVADRIATGLFRRYLVAMATALALLVADGLWMGAEYPENWMDLSVATLPLMVGKQAEVFDKLRRLQGAIGPGGVVASGCAGIPSYFSDYRMVDLFGYNERHIARQPPAVPLGIDNYGDLQPGHSKWDYAYVLARYHPDAFLQPFPPQDPGSLLTAAGYHRDPSNDFWLLGKVTPARE